MKLMSRAFFAIFIIAISQVSYSAELPDFTKLVEERAPAVVNISTTKKVSNQNRGIPQELLDQLGPFRHFFESPGQGGGRQAPQPRDQHHSLGSGFIISEDGYVITNNHVIDGADEVIVKLNDRRELIAEVIGSDASSDIALLKVEGEDLPTVPLGNDDNVKVGEWVLAIGSPFGFDATVTAGIVSAKGRALPNENYVPFLQTDVAINPGNSGGPLFNLKGEVVGVNSQIYSRTGGFMGLSFAIPINVAMNVVEQLKDTGSVSRGWLGVAIQEVTRDLAQGFGLDKPMGALVSDFSSEDSPAAKSGIEIGDIILKFNGTIVERSSSLPPLVGRVASGTKVPVVVMRQGKEKTITVKLGELDSGQVVSSKGQQNEPSMDSLGLNLGDPSDKVRDALKVAKGGAFVKEIVAGAAADAGIMQGDVITSFNNVTIKSASHFADVLDSIPPGRIVPVLVVRKYGRQYIALRIPK